MSLVTLGRTDINGVIPPEILSEIFIHCLPKDYPSHNTKNRLSRVCRQWRAVVLSTPALWSSFDIMCNDEVLRPPLPVIRTHLQRSGASPLSIIIRGAEFSHRGSPHLLSILMTLAAARQRWDSLELIPRRMTQDVLDFITQGSAPLLRRMKCDDIDHKELPIPLSMVHNYPRLESLEWRGPGPIILPLVDIPLTSLSLDTRLSVSECIAFLRLSPRLSSAKFPEIQSADPSPASRFTHPTLCTFSIAGNYSTTLLDALTLPVLTDLDLDFRIDTSTPPPEWGIPLATFLERSNSPLHNLSLRLKSMPLEPAFVRIFTSTPHLRVLKVTKRTLFSALPAGLVRALHPQAPPDTPPCPRLRRLDLSVVSDRPNGLCGAILRARWGAAARANGVACLEQTDIKIDNGEHQCDLEDMAELRAEGMLGRISYYYPLPNTQPSCT